MADPDSAREDRVTAEALFVPEGDRFMPTDYARGPWTREAQHGGPPSALLTRALERYEDGERMNLARVTVELMRPVPIAPLQLRASWLRPGKKVQLVTASMLAGETEVARATGLRIRRSTLELPDLGAPEPVPPPPEQGEQRLPPWASAIEYPGFHSRGVEHRFVAGGFDRPGAATDWIRLCLPLVAGEETSPVCRVLAVADFGNGISWVLDRRDGYSFINPDLTVYLSRPPEGEWICLQAVSDPQPIGMGLAESRLWDRRGPIGRALQSLFLEKH